MTTYIHSQNSSNTYFPDGTKIARWFELESAVRRMNIHLLLICGSISFYGAVLSFIKQSQIFISFLLQRPRYTVLLREKMTKLMQKLVFIIEQTDESDTDTNCSGRASTIGYLYMNRFTIDEDASHEIVSIYGVEEYNPNYRSHIVEEEEQKGMGHNIFLEFGFDVSFFSLWRL